MDSFIEEYERRKVEIDEYLDLLSCMNKDGARIIDLDDVESSINPLAFKVCKASSYLIIYNLVEATVTAGVKSIYDKIADEGLTFNDVMEKLRKVWWQSKNGSLSSCSKNQLIDNIYDYYCEAHSDDPLDFSNYISGVSGNLDAESIREVCRRYGISSVQDGRDLGNIKTKRNWLAHGNKSFSDIGKDSTPSDLFTVRGRVFSFLDEFVGNVNSYLNETKYKQAS